MHRDINPKNLMINKSGIIKLTDFGLSRSFGLPLTQLTPYVTSLWYRPPEIVLGSFFYDISIDIWSVGCVIAEMVNEEHLFGGDSDLDQAVNIFKMLGTPDEYWPENPAHLRESFQNYPKRPLSEFIQSDDEDLLDLLSKLLEIDPEKRISAKDALNHPFFDSLPHKEVFCPTFE